MFCFVFGGLKSLSAYTGLDRVLVMTRFRSFFIHVYFVCLLGGPIGKAFSC